MKRILFVAAFFVAFACACGNNDTVEPTPAPPPAPTPDPDPEETIIPTPAFAKGADISWASEMEADGRKFKKKDGTSAALLDVLKDCGINAIRLRVWVNPYEGWSGKDDVVRMAKKVSAAGMALMVDFHYSDFFADPIKQKIPDTWTLDKDVLTKMCGNVSSHTTEVLQALKDAGVSVNWVQVGNETRNGMLWPTGQLWTDAGDIQDGRKHFAQLYMAGYNAVKYVYPSAQVMPHLNHAYEDNAWWFRQIKAAGATFDAIGLSHYPASDSNHASKIAVTNDAVTNINKLKTEFEVPVYITEIGIERTFEDAQTILEYAYNELKKITAGIFYWEPEVDGAWKPDVYDDAVAIGKYTGKVETWQPYKAGAFDTAGKPTALMDIFAD